jgi:hypothetical protein
MAPERRSASQARRETVREGQVGPKGVGVTIRRVLASVKAREGLALWKGPTWKEERKMMKRIGLIAFSVLLLAGCGNIVSPEPARDGTGAVGSGSQHSTATEGTGAVGSGS